MSPELESILKGAGLLSEQKLDLGFVDSGSYALNKIISGRFDGGYPIGGITEIIGESSVGKTGFLTHLFRSGQDQDYVCALADNEFAYSEPFAAQLGVDSSRLAYFKIHEIDTAPKCFQKMTEFIEDIRKVDQETPIVIALDSLGTLQSADEGEKNMEEGSNMDGAIRAKELGGLLRKFNPLVRKHKVCCVFINQYRSKAGVVMGDPRTRAGGGKALEFYCSVSLQIGSNKSTDILKDKGFPTGFKGLITNKKNKCTVPYQECSFLFDYKTGLDRYAGLATQLERAGLAERNGAWYVLKDTEAKFQDKSLPEFIENNKPGYESVRELLGLSLVSAEA